MVNNAITSTCFINSFKSTSFSFTFGKFSLFLSLMLDKKIKPNIPGITGSKNNHIDKNINLEISSTCSQREITVDLVKLKRVFGNIINNSVTHFNGRDGLIKINVLSRANMIRFEIADNGGGVKTETDLKRIFEPLYTTDPSRKISGLGLSICKQIISSFDGRIYAKNNEIGGLSIIFLIPKS